MHYVSSIHSALTFYCNKCEETINFSDVRMYLYSYMAIYICIAKLIKLIITPPGGSYSYNSTYIVTLYVYDHYL